MEFIMTKEQFINNHHEIKRLYCLDGEGLALAIANPRPAMEPWGAGPNMDQNERDQYCTDLGTLVDLYEEVLYSLAFSKAREIIAACEGDEYLTWTVERYFEVQASL
jgi:hypothetical protein